MSMFKNIFSTDAPADTNFHPVTSAFPPSALFGPLEQKDTEWAQGPGFCTETQVWYQVFENGTFLFCQVIHSSIGLWSPQVQFTCKIFDPSTGEQSWTSANVSKFTTPPPPSSTRTYDKRSSQSDKFKIIHTPASADAPEMYKIDAQPEAHLQLSLTIERPNGIEGWKLGASEKGGFSFFGENPDKPEGMVVHRFWPRTSVTGIAVLNGKVIEAKGPGMFVHAIQGMRPNLIAQRWNFGHFLSRSDELGGVSAIMMEFQTIESFGRKAKGQEGQEGKIVGEAKVNVGCVVAGGKLVAVTGETQWADEAEGERTGVLSRCVHAAEMLDKDTGYKVPSSIQWTWKGPALEGEGEVLAKMTSELGAIDKPRGLLEKVDVLAEIPYMVRKMINYVAGTKPYIYQYFNPATLEVTLPGQAPTTIQGTLFNEASFISNP